jgi:hypothetical protein
MNSIGTLVGVRFVGAQKPLVHALGLNAAVFLNECLYWQVKVGEGGWFNRTIPQLTEETGLSKSEQATVRQKLVSMGLIEEQKGVQYRTQTRVNIDRFNEFLTEIQPQEISRLEETAAQNLSASRSKSVGSYNSHSNNESKETEQTEDFALVSDEVVPYAKYQEEGITPWVVWEEFCKGIGFNPNQLTGHQLQRQLHTAKLIMKDGIEAREVGDCTRWLVSDKWWQQKGVTINDVRNQYPRWVSLGKPKASIIGGKQIRGATPSL